MRAWRFPSPIFANPWIDIAPAVDVSIAAQLTSLVWSSSMGSMQIALIRSRLDPLQCYVDFTIFCFSLTDPMVWWDSDRVRWPWVYDIVHCVKRKQSQIPADSWFLIPDSWFLIMSWADLIECKHVSWVVTGELKTCQGQRLKSQIVTR